MKPYLSLNFRNVTQVRTSHVLWAHFFGCFLIYYFPCFLKKCHSCTEVQPIPNTNNIDYIKSQKGFLDWPKCNHCRRNPVETHLLAPNKLNPTKDNGPIMFCSNAFQSMQEEYRHDMKWIIILYMKNI